MFKMFTTGYNNLENTTMKLATIKNNTRDGQLIIVNRDLTKAVKVPEIAQTMQEALDNWDIISLKLEKVYNALQNNTMPNTFNFDSSQAMAAIPRAYHWADGSAYVTHVELVRKSSKCRITKDILDRPSNVHGSF